MIDVLIPGHVYNLPNRDGEGSQKVLFVRRRDFQGQLLPEDQGEPGIMSQDLIRVLIDRTLYLYCEAPCDEDTAIVEHLREALRLYEARAARRHIERLTKPEVHDPCPDCGHLLCRHDPGGFS